MNRQCLADFLHIPPVVAGNFSAIGMFSHGDEKINMSFPFSADHGEIIIFHVAAAFPHDSHILPYGHGHYMIVRYHMKLGHPAKAIIEIQGRFRFSALFYGRKGRGKGPEGPSQGPQDRASGAQGGGRSGIARRGPTGEILARRGFTSRTDLLIRQGLGKCGFGSCGVW